MRFLVAFTFALAATGVQADSATDSYFRSLDLNGDGYVSSAEAAGFRDIVIRFDKADRNRDGKLSRAEFARLKSMQAASSATGGTANKRSSKKAAD
jgi:Ca2+-binding EF-hand superfamily protein